MTASLREDLDTAVRSVAGPANQGLDVQGCWTTAVPLDEPGALLPVQARMATSGSAFTLLAPLAELEEPYDVDLFATLLRHCAHPDQTGGAGYAVLTEESGELLVALEHWVLPSISKEQFRALLLGFASAVRGMRGDVRDMIERGAPLRLLEEPLD
jgi:hypothetical protein